MTVSDRLPSKSALAKRLKRHRLARTPQSLPCEHPGCVFLFRTLGGMRNHMRKVHGVRGAANGNVTLGTVHDRQDAVERLLPRVNRGGNVDSESLWSLLFHDARKRVA
jgi:hypothetical protein